jgi:integrase
LKQNTNQSEQKLVVYREIFTRLLNAPKSLRDQLIFDLPCLQAFRAGEVSSLKVEYVCFESGDITVLDSKKKTEMPRPLDPIVAKHIAEYIQQEHLTRGILLQPLPTAHHVGRKPGSKTVGAGISTTQIGRIWEKYCKALGIPVMPARMGRAYFACYEHYVLGKPIGYIQFMLRHDDLQSTEHYLYEKIVSYEDQKAIFLRGKQSPFSPSPSCSRFDACPLSAPNCKCRMFQNQVMEEQHETLL